MTVKTRPARTGLVLLLAMLGIVLAVCTATYLHEAESIAKRLREREASRVEFFAYALPRELQAVTVQLRMLARGDALAAFLVSGRAADLRRAQDHAAFLSRQQPSYDQIRYLDDEGQELMRVNEGGYLVPPHELQNKGGRPYVRDSADLKPGEVRVSVFDLNVEGGEVEVPFKPVVRFSTAVFDSRGKRRGLYVVNYLGARVLENLGQAAPASAERLRVLNADGYWIKGARPDEEWGFVFQDRAHLTLSRMNPELWARVSREETGQRAHEGGIFTWAHVTPAQFASTAEVAVDEPFLIVASQVSASEWASQLAGLRRVFLLAVPGLLALVTGSFWHLDRRRRAALALRRSEERLSVTLNSIGDAVLATDLSGGITLMNRVAERLTGWDRDEARGRPVGEVFHIINETTRAPATIPVDAVLATGEIQGLANHTILIGRDGVERAIADSAAPIRDHDGAVTGVVMAFRDVTVERAAEVKVEAAHAELDRFFSLSLDFLCISSVDGYFKRVSPAVTDILGWTVEEFLSRPFIDMVHPDDRDSTLREVERQVVGGEKVMRFDNRYLHKDGSWRILSWRSMPQPGGLMYATARDVTTRRADQEALRKSEAEYRTLFESIDEGCCIIEMIFDEAGRPHDYRFLRTNPAFETHTGLKGATGKTMRSLAPQIEEHWIEALGQVATTGEPKRFENYAAPLKRWFDVYAFRYGDAVNRHVAILFSNSTERRAAEDRLAAVNAELQAQARELESANKELEAFSYSVSHDLRAPLRSVDSFSRIVLEDYGPSLDAEGRRMLNVVRSEAQRMGLLIDDLLAFARLARQPMKTGPCDLTALAQAVIERQDLPAEAATRFDLKPLPPANGDPSMLRQVFVNLIGNAVKFSSRAKDPLVEIGATAAEDFNTYYVKDNGAGFDPRYVHKLFGVFQRLHAESEFEGTGVGLAIVQRVIHRHGGTVWAEGQVDEGATFYFTLPAPK